MIQRVDHAAALQAAQVAARVSAPSALFADVLGQSMSRLDAASAKTPPAAGGAGAAVDVSPAPDFESLKSSLLMLCMMLAQSGGQYNPLAFSLMSRLASMVGQMQPVEKEELRKETMDAEVEHEVLDKVDQDVFRHVPDAERYPYEAWRACTPAVTNAAGERSAQSLRAVIAQFGVETNGRYEVNKRGRDDTYCNIFAWDVTGAMGAEVPHYIDRATGDIRTYPDTKGASELSANATYDWLAQHGGRYGWKRVSEEEAQALANAGRPAVGVYKNPSGHGHIQVVCPSRDGAFNAEKGVTVAQAGSNLTEYAYTADLSRRDRSKIAYYAHE